MSDEPDVRDVPLRLVDAERHLAEFLIAFLRSIARRQENHLLGEHLIRFVQAVVENEVTVGEVHRMLSEEIEFYAAGLDMTGDTYADHLRQAARAGAGLIAERRCGDPAAGARASRHEQKMLAAVRPLNTPRPPKPVVIEMPSAPRIVRRDYRDELGFVYVAAAGPHVKIGWAINVEYRLAALQTGCPVRLELLKAFDGSRATEAELHRRFAEQRTTGEWFVREGPVAAWVDAGCPL